MGSRASKRIRERAELERAIQTQEQTIVRFNHQRLAALAERTADGDKRAKQLQEKITAHGATLMRLREKRDRM